MTFTSYSSQQFLEEYEFDAIKDFEKNGEAPQWAPGYPKHWGQEDDIIVCPEDPLKDETTYRPITADLSSDEVLLAMASGGFVYIYDLAEKSLQQILRQVDTVRNVKFNPNLPGREASSGNNNRAGYVLMVAASDRNFRKDRTYFWDLDSHGRLLSENEALDTRLLASKAVDSLRPDLIATKWTEEEFRTHALEDKFQTILNEAEILYANEGASTVEGGTTGFGSQGPFQNDGKFFLSYRRSGKQHKATDTISVIDTATYKAKSVLSGHTDYIMWSGWSPDSQYIATVAWDSTMRMYSAHDGELLWATETVPGQAWTAAFSPDSTHILLSTTGGQVVNMYAVPTGALEVCILDKEIDGEKVKRWIRNFGWHPSGEKIVLAPEDGTAYEIDPFAKPPKVLQKFVMKPDHSSFPFGALHIYWTDNGRKIVLRSSDNTYNLWDKERHIQWRMVRPKGTKCKGSENSWWLLKDGRFLSVDGDMKARLWNLD